MRNKNLRLEKNQRNNQKLRKTLRKTQIERDRLRVIAYNAIVKWREDAMEHYIDPEEEMDYILGELGITKTEYDTIMDED